MADIPRYHSYLDYYRPPRRAPGADVWGEINRGVQGALSSYMKYQQEKDYNDFQGLKAAALEGFSRDKSQEEFAKYVMGLKDKFKISKNLMGRFDVFAGGLAKQLMPQKQLNASVLRQQEIAKGKAANKREKIIKSFVNNASATIESGTNQYLFDNGISLNPRVNIDNKLKYSGEQVKKLSENKDIFVKAGILEKDIPEVVKRIGIKLKGSFSGESDLNRIEAYLVKKNNKAISLQKKIEKENKLNIAKKEKALDIYRGKMEKGLTSVGSDEVILQDVDTKIDDYKVKKVAMSATAKLYPLAQEALKMKDVKTLPNIMMAHSRIVKKMKEGSNLSRGRNKKFIADIKTRNLRKAIGEIIGFKSAKTLEGNLLDPTFVVDPELRVPNEITRANIAEIKKGLGKTVMNGLYKTFAPYINRSTELNKMLTDMFIFNYITEYGRPDGF